MVLSAPSALDALLLLEPVPKKFVRLVLPGTVGPLLPVPMLVPAAPVVLPLLLSDVWELPAVGPVEPLPVDAEFPVWFMLAKMVVTLPPADALLPVCAVLLPVPAALVSVVLPAKTPVASTIPVLFSAAVVSAAVPFCALCVTSLLPVVTIGVTPDAIVSAQAGALTIMVIAIAHAMIDFFFIIFPDPLFKACQAMSADTSDGRFSILCCVFILQNFTQTSIIIPISDDM